MIRVLISFDIFCVSKACPDLMSDFRRPAPPSARCARSARSAAGHRCFWRSSHRGRTVVGPWSDRCYSDATNSAHLALRDLHPHVDFPISSGHLPKSDLLSSSVFICLLHSKFIWRCINIHRECIRVQGVKRMQQRRRHKNCIKINSTQLWLLHHGHGHVA